MAILAYEEYVEEDEQRNLNHADLHSNATAHFKAVKAEMYVQMHKYQFLFQLCLAFLSIYEK